MEQQQQQQLAEIIGFEVMFRFEQKPCAYCGRRINNALWRCPCCGYPQQSKLLNPPDPPVETT